MAVDTRSLLQIAQQYALPGLPIKARLEGVAPGFLMHAGESQALNTQAAEEWRKSGKRSKYIPTPEDEARWGVYRLTDDPHAKALYMPSKNLRRSLVEAAKAFKMPKSRASMFKAVAAGVTTPPDSSPGFPLFYPEGENGFIFDYAIDVQRAVVQKASIMRARPLVAAWACEAEFLLDPEAVPPEVFAEILGYAGSRIGIGDNRPEKGGENGRFIITGLEVVEPGAPENGKTKTKAKV